MVFKTQRTMSDVAYFILQGLKQVVFVCLFVVLGTKCKTWTWEARTLC